MVEHLDSVVEPFTLPDLPSHDGLPRVTDGDALFASPDGWSHHVLDSEAIDLPIHIVVSLLAAVV